MYDIQEFKNWAYTKNGYLCGGYLYPSILVKKQQERNTIYLAFKHKLHICTILDI